MKSNRVKRLQKSSTRFQSSTFREIIEGVYDELYPEEGTSLHAAPDGL